MCYNLTWILFLIIQIGLVAPKPARDGNNEFNYQFHPHHLHDTPNISNAQNQQVISVRITSSVAIDRGKGKLSKNENVGENYTETGNNENIAEDIPADLQMNRIIHNEEQPESTTTQKAPYLIGANLEFIKQLNAKKNLKEQNYDHNNPFQIKKQETFLNENTGTMLSPEGHDRAEGEESIDENNEPNMAYIPLARKIPETYYTNRVHINKEPETLSISNVLHNIQTKNLYSDKINDSTIRYMTTESYESDYYDERSVTLTSYETEHTTEQTTHHDIKYDNNTREQENDSFDFIAEPSLKTISETVSKEIVPLATSMLLTASLPNNVQSRTKEPPYERENHAKLTTVSFNVVHDTSHSSTNIKQVNVKTYTNQNTFYGLPEIYSEPAQIYSEPAKFYSEPAKIYSEPAKIYSEPSKIYSEPAKVYSEPAKFYSKPASLHLESSSNTDYTPWQNTPSLIFSSILNTTPIATVSTLTSIKKIGEHQPEKSYEVDEKESVLTNGRSHGIQESSTEKCKQDNCKVGYVVEGRQYKKYRVEERTSDGFIVGEYGVVRNEDGALRGVRYTADSDASPTLIYDALMKFLQLK